ncbi:MAG: SDR family NAD(P)-dependent oxidoreductase [Gammaproteobacteria bacterium]|nr:SDR family NAD(P)-dependent oxidoreductase [Gammaproteobacteria bacterium]MCY4217871.1 SDR family NAD(P)-dependent oxidoreductase [Gammaproteobacteria bacterium]MCY4274561.1 SDR family NAD(P)-dependent oxidoreductase [Gammaproteobacteria bacterium]
MIENKVAIITGAAGGIGYACAKRFFEEGAKVILSDIDKERGWLATQNLDDSGEKTHFVHCDVSKSQEVKSLFAEANEKFGRVDVVIANAGIVHVSDILDLKEDAYDRVMSVNLKGVFLTGQIAAQHMIEQEPDEDGARGIIINMSSLNGVLAIPEIAPYVIAKGGVNQWTKCLGIAMANKGIRVNGIGPGSIATELFHTIADNPDKYRTVLSRTPMLRPGEPDEVAKVAVFLASNYSSYITGETIYVDGGRMGLNYVVPVH